MTAKEIRTAVSFFKKFVRNMPMLISPVLNVAHRLQKIKGDVNLRKVMTSDDGVWKSQICVNLSTLILHTECDCTYTLIIIPLQKIKRSKNSKMDSMFLFQLHKDTTISLPLQSGLSFAFSGLFLTHRQNYPNHLQVNTETFYNVASYGNKKLFNHLQC